MKHRVTLTAGEIRTLAHITRHFADYIFGDDRPDHGMGILKQYREADKDATYVKDFLSAMGKLNRFHRKIR